MTREEMIEYLADKEHASWAHWMKYLFSKCEQGNFGQMVIPAAFVARWARQADTPYEGLSDREQQSDRDEVAHILPIIDEYVQFKVLEKLSLLANKPPIGLGRKTINKQSKQED